MTPKIPICGEDGSEILGLPRWITIRRETGLVEHVCEHNVGHPNHGSALWLAEAYEIEGDDVFDGYAARLIHGCDGCCAREDFPGTLFESLRHAHNMIRERNTIISNQKRQIDDHQYELMDAVEMACDHN